MRAPQDFIGPRMGMDPRGERNSPSYFLEELLVQRARYAVARERARKLRTVAEKRHAETHRHQLLSAAQLFRMAGGDARVSANGLRVARKVARMRLKTDNGGCGCFYPDARGRMVPRQPFPGPP